VSNLKLNMGSVRNWGEGELEEVKEAIKVMRELVRCELERKIITLRLGPADERLAEAIPTLNDAFRSTREFISSTKRRARVLDYADLEVHALRALEHEEVRVYYRERWRAFLVDEFQDTNPVQSELLDRLTEGAKLTVVGDEKQSIYGFRRADVTVFRHFRERILSEGGSEALLATSFRTHAGLMRTFNVAFSPMLGDLHQDLKAHRQQPPHEAPHVRACAIEAQGKVPKAKLQRAEAAHIARLVRQMLDEQVPV
jgi:ATP-dependent helicase/nuclease subunit A